MRALKPITCALDSDEKNYIQHWSHLIMYGTYCKLIGTASELVPVYPPLTLRVLEAADMKDAKED